MLILLRIRGRLLLAGADFAIKQPVVHVPQAD